MRPTLVADAPAPVAGPAVLARTTTLADEWRAHARRQLAIVADDPAAKAMLWCADRMVEAVTTASRDDDELTPSEYGAQPHVQRTGSTVRRWCQRGLIPCRQVGRDYRIRRATPVPAFAGSGEGAAA